MLANVAFPNVSVSVHNIHNTNPCLAMLPYAYEADLFGKTTFPLLDH